MSDAAVMGRRRAVCGGSGGMGAVADEARAEESMKEGLDIGIKNPLSTLSLFNPKPPLLRKKKAINNTRQVRTIAKENSKIPNRYKRTRIRITPMMLLAHHYMHPYSLIVNARLT